MLGFSSFTTCRGGERARPRRQRMCQVLGLVRTQSMLGSPSAHAWHDTATLDLVMGVGSRGSVDLFALTNNGSLQRDMWVTGPTPMCLGRLRLRRSQSRDCVLLHLVPLWAAACVGHLVCHSQGRFHRGQSCYSGCCCWHSPWSGQPVAHDRTQNRQESASLVVMRGKHGTAEHDDPD
jgi:hypothetical protein